MFWAGSPTNFSVGTDTADDPSRKFEWTITPVVPGLSKHAEQLPPSLGHAGIESDEAYDISSVIYLDNGHWNSVRIPGTVPDLPPPDPAGAAGSGVPNR